MKKRFISFFAVFLYMIYLEAASLLGPGVSVYRDEELKWEQRNVDYFIFFKSLLSNNITWNDSPGNPQADKCKSASSYKLSDKYFPEDAYVERAFLIWSGAVEPSKYDENVDNKITLKFKNSADETILLSEEIEGPAHYLTDSGSFEYESVRKVISQDDVAYFTYRVDITDFFEKLYHLGRNAGFENLVDSVIGTYTVSNLDCSEDNIYVLSSTMVSGWAILVIYSSADEKMKPKNLYIYNGTDLFWHNDAEINVKGFVFPENPYAKLTMMVFEGDPDNVIAGTYMENLFFRGDSELEWNPLSNRCNPDKGSYTEIYNSISSRFYWEDDENTKPFCLGGVGGNSAEVNTETIQYAMDVDTFLVSNENCKGHLKEGDTDLDLKISANQDVILTNLLVLSVDTRASDFDIPGERELNICSCSDDSFKVCMERSFYYTIKVQNWGDKTAKNVLVKKTILPQEKYIPETTQIKYRSEGETSDWEKIDEEKGSFPLDSGYRLPFNLQPCTPSTKTTCDTAVIRFKVDRPDGVSAWDKGEFITASATIEEDLSVYRTNTGVPLKITMDQNCPNLSICRSPDLDICGRLDEPQCETDTDCSEKQACNDGFCVTVECTQNEHCSYGEVCLDNICVYKPDCEGASCFEKDLIIHVKRGKNSPFNNWNPIYLEGSRNNLELAQVAIAPESKLPDNPEFYFYSVFFDFKTGTEDLRNHLSDFRLIYDENGNGIYDSNEKIISEAKSLVGGSIEFPVNKVFSTGKIIYFIVICKYSTASESGPDPFSFTPFIAGQTGVRIDDDVSSSIDIEDELLFESFVVIPESYNSVIVSKTDIQPPVPDDISGEYSVLSFVMISTEKNVTLNSIELNLKRGDKYGSFGENIKEISIYSDLDENGIVDEQDSLIRTVSSFNNDKHLLLDNLSVNFNEGEKRNFIITAKVNLPDSYMLLFSINSGGILISPDCNIEGLPLFSKSISDLCDFKNSECTDKCFGEPCGNSKGCSCSVVF